MSVFTVDPETFGRGKASRVMEFSLVLLIFESAEHGFPFSLLVEVAGVKPAYCNHSDLVASSTNRLISETNFTRFFLIAGRVN